MIALYKQHMTFPIKRSHIKYIIFLLPGEGAYDRILVYSFIKTIQLDVRSLDLRFRHKYRFTLFAAALYCERFSHGRMLLFCIIQIYIVGEQTVAMSIVI